MLLKPLFFQKKTKTKNPPSIASPLVIQFAVKGHELKYTVYAKSRKQGK